MWKYNFSNVGMCHSFLNILETKVCHIWKCCTTSIEHVWLILSIESRDAHPKIALVWYGVVLAIKLKFPFYFISFLFAFVCIDKWERADYLKQFERVIYKYNRERLLQW